MQRSLAALCLALLTLGCVPGGLLPTSGGAGTDIATDALTTEAISAQPLDAPEDAAAAPQTPAAEDEAPTGEAEAATDAAALETDPAAPQDTAPAAPEAEPVPEAEAEPAPPSSPEEAACVRKGGLWIHAGKSIAFTCVKITRDSGKQCQRGTDCQGLCLARSRTCAPYDPLFGCNEILQDDGSRVTLCID